MNTTTLNTTTVNWFDCNLPHMGDYESWIAEEIQDHAGVAVHVQLVKETGLHILTGLAEDVAQAVAYLGKSCQVLGSTI